MNKQINQIEDKKQELSNLKKEKEDILSEIDNYEDIFINLKKDKIKICDQMENISNTIQEFENLFKRIDKEIEEQEKIIHNLFTN